jgi:hypothetical protein
MDPAASDTQLQDAVARADQARRARDASVSLWQAAPVAAAACLLVAIAGRLRAWTPLVTLLVLSAAALALAVYVLAARRRRAPSDAEVARIDADADLRGELRSAHWFASLPAAASAQAGDDWVAFHLARAAERVRGVDWTALYPAPPSGRAKILTGGIAAAAVLLAILVPGRAGLAASPEHGTAAAARRPNVVIALPPDVRKQLEDMLVKAESGQGRALTAAEVRDLLARLDELAHGDPSKKTDPAANAAGQQPDASKADLKAFAERAKKASESTSLEPSVRDALADVADKLTNGDQDANAMAARDAQDAAVKPDASGDVQQSKSGSGKQDGASVQSVKDAAGGSSVGVVMMTTDETSNSRDGGLGLGGGTSDRNGGGHMNDLGAALRKETIDASADLAGENVQTDKRRDTEHADAGAAFTHAAAQPAERGSSTAPPPVPESRRAAVKSYFIRKQ